MSKVPCGGFKLDENFFDINENDELSLVGGEGKAYQYVVTDGNGNVKWEDRLAYVATDEQVIFSQENIAFTEHSGLYVASGMPITAISSGEKVRVDFDGETYDCIVSVPIDDTIFIGNLSLFKLGDDTGEPFVIDYNPAPTAIAITTNLTNPTHTVSITRIAETVHTIPQVYLPKNYRVVFVITYGNEGSSSISCNCSYEELKSFCIGKSVPILGSLYDKDKVKGLAHIEYNEEGATIYLKFNSGSGGFLELSYKQDGSITRSAQ